MSNGYVGILASVVAELSRRDPIYVEKYQDSLRLTFMDIQTFNKLIQAFTRNKLSECENVICILLFIRVSIRPGQLSIFERG